MRGSLDHIIGDAPCNEIKIGRYIVIDGCHYWVFYKHFRAIYEQKRKDEINKEEYVYLSAVDGLHNALKSQDKVKIRLFQLRIAYFLRSEKDELSKDGVSASLKAQEVRQFRANVKYWDVSSHDLVSLLFLNPCALFDCDLSVYKRQQKECIEILNKLTGLSFELHGCALAATNKFFGDRSSTRSLENKIMSVLIGHGILRGDFNNDDNYWICYVIDSISLSKLTKETLVAEMKEASTWIAQITGSPCELLEIKGQDPYYPTRAADHNLMSQLDFLEMNKFYFHYYRYIDNYNIEKLRRYCGRSISILDLWDKKDSSKKKENKLKITFHGSISEGISIKISNIPFMRDARKFEQCTMASGLTTKISIDPPSEPSYESHLIVLNLPGYDDNGQPYGDLKNLFKRNNYRSWRRLILEIFPKLKDYLSLCEKIGILIEELSTIDNNIDSIEDRIADIFQEMECDESNGNSELKIGEEESRKCLELELSKFKKKYAVLQQKIDALKQQAVKEQTELQNGRSNPYMTFWSSRADVARMDKQGKVYKKQ